MDNWGEIRNDFIDDDTGIATIDAWVSEDDNEEGKVIATFDTNTGEVIYKDDRAKTDAYAQEIIQELKDDYFPEPITMGKTQRGFGKGKFKDAYGAECSIQKSSLATKDAIWLGIEDAKPQIMCNNAERNGLVKQGDCGWQPFEIPKDVMLTTTMHLTQKEVRQLLPILEKFAKTGEID